jgi:hypothetical protein
MENKEIDTILDEAIKEVARRINECDDENIARRINECDDENMDKLAYSMKLLVETSFQI